MENGLIHKQATKYEIIRIYENVLSNAVATDFFVFSYVFVLRSHFNR